MSISTIVSILPFHTEEYKPSVIPSIVIIPECTDPDDPVFLHIEDAQTIEYIPLKGSRHNYLRSIDFARSIVNDKLNAIFGRDPERNIMPGIAFVEGTFLNVKDLKAKHPMLLSVLKDNQRKWQEHLVTLADDDWQKFKQHRMINDLQRNAAKALGIKREWMVEIADRSNMECPVCFEIINAKALKCRFCQSVLNPTAYAVVAKVAEKKE